MAAEISSCSAAAPRASPRFNEAAANGRGNRPLRRTVIFSEEGFNEAAANGRGNRGRRCRRGFGLWASMRPRRMAAEIPGAWCRR